MLHDEKHYPYPLVFNPDRFLQEDGTLSPEIVNPETFAFGSSWNALRIGFGACFGFGDVLTAQTSGLACEDVEEAARTWQPPLKSAKTAR